ncbi:hypothetical protein NQ317_000456 [Molorchus minor]|uniref:Uncharacterized protein n=1 Tax=Molorchus minor TaxID=1323400 RepID=A0ABQ9J6Y1_9CUCU|nr:hypothetical protein NQ317_000456 [Molorchus minor]
MDEVLPNEPPYILKFRKNLTFNYGDPIDLSGMVFMSVNCFYNCGQTSCFDRCMKAGLKR